MRYRDLVQFEPLDTIIQLRDADNKTAARQLVETYVFSARMTEQLADLVVPNLRLDRATDAKGIFIVGNYGTGKSHLMSVLSAVAEHGDLLPLVRSQVLQEKLESVAGQFKVVRMELGGVTRRLRDSIVDSLQTFLAEQGAPYTFPSVDTVSNNKDALLEAIAGFRAVHPDHGILFILDELLDFLRSQDERALLLDLGFLREIGEVAELAPFRFIAGVQESLFDSPSFAFVADQLRRVRERFEQVRIAREDIAYVVAERLLRKTDRQLADITEHLRQFSPLYPPMADRLDEFARLFPIHPAYIETLEQLYIAEKREVLRTYSLAMSRVLDQEVPKDQTGLIAYDHYWLMIKDNPALRAQDGVAQVVSKSDVLAGRIENAYTRKNLLPMARRIIAALSVQRLTTSDINAPIGVTVDELRDGLCLWTPMPESDAQFLADTIRVALNEILRTVNGQYISFNQENDQYYLDLKKDIDFEANVKARGEFIEEVDLNRYFFDALVELMGLQNTAAYVPNYRIWFYELPWAEKKVTRPGYFFCLEPNERSTAQPPRDFYLYFLPPYRDSDKPAPTSEQPDEVLFALTGLDESFQQIVRNYAGARALSTESPAHAQTYGDMADAHRRRLRRWLEQNLTAKLRISFRGVTSTASELLASMRSTGSASLVEMLTNIAAHLLAPQFAETYPSYPTFSRVAQPITESSRGPSAMDAIRMISGRGRTNLALAVLDALELLDEQGQNLRPLASPYARHFLEVLQGRGENQVVNYGEVVEQVAGGLQLIFKDARFKLEPEWVAVILTALVYDGQIELAPAGTQANLDASSVERAATLALDDLTNFRFYKRPRGLPLAVWQQIFEGLGLQSALIREENSRADAVRELQALVSREVEEIVQWQSRVQQGFSLWNASLYTDNLTFQTQGGQVVGHSELSTTRLSSTDLLPSLRGVKQFLESLNRFNTPGKLRNLTMNAIQAQEGIDHRQKARRVKSLLDVVDALQPTTAYLAAAEVNLPDDPWTAEASAAKAELLDALRKLARGEGQVSVRTWRTRLEQLKQGYIDRYAELHRRARLTGEEDNRRRQLLEDARVKQLRQLSTVDIFATQQDFRTWMERATSLKACLEFHTGLLADAPICPHCQYRPSSQDTDATGQLAVLDERLDTILSQWHDGLRSALQSEMAQQSLEAMTATERKPLETYLAFEAPRQETLPPKLAEAANRALRGLQTVTVEPDELLAALRQGGLPCTVGELQQRVKHYLDGILRGHDATNTRITLE